VVGITVYPEDGEDTNTLIRNAATAMNEAKRRGKEFLVFNAELHERSVAKLKLESEMFSAFGGNQYRLHYQPVVDPSGRIVGCEALIRWQHPEMGLMSPGRFIPLAEETGLIMSIGKWALYRACKQARRWSTEYGLYVSVNLSAHEFENPNLPQIVSGVLKSAEDLDPRYLKLEITETESMGDPEFAIGQMRALLDMGVELCIDDFGQGRSSLTYLKTLPATTLKIDRAFVEGIVEDAAEREYLDSIIRMVRSRKKTVLVEGVSRPAQVELLKPMRCDLMQGFYFSKPLPAEELDLLLERTMVFPV